MAKFVILILALILLALHQDTWNWSDAGLVFGFIPKGLAYHALYSLAAAALGGLAILFAWPSDLEEATEAESSAKNQAGKYNVT